MATLDTLAIQAPSLGAPFLSGTVVENARPLPQSLQGPYVPENQNLPLESELASRCSQAISFDPTLLQAPTQSLTNSKKYFTFKSYQDPYSQVATLAHTTLPNPTRIVATPEALVCRDLNCFQKLFGRVFCTASYTAWQNENRQAVEQYKRFLLTEYGESKVKQVQYTFRGHTLEMDLDRLIASSSPLSSEHVHLFNIGLANIEQYEVELLFKKLKLLNISNITGNLLEFFESLLSQPSTPLSLNGQEIRGILNDFEKRGGDLSTLCIQDFYETFIKPLQNLSAESHSESLPSSIFNRLIDILQPPVTDAAYGDAVYTGKKITAPIKGAYHDGYFHVFFRPWLDQQELLQLFPEMQQTTDWNAYYELLSKAFVKKHLVREDSTNAWRVGALIPAPNSKTGQKQWYRVDEVIDSGFGKFYYVLVPASDNYDKDMPIIRLYRSTASDPCAMGGGPTVLRDIYPRAPLGYLYSDSSPMQDQEWINKTTTPFYAAYLLAANAYEKTIDLKADYEHLLAQEKHLLSLLFQGVKSLPNPAILIPSYEMFYAAIIDPTLSLQDQLIGFEAYEQDYLQALKQKNPTTTLDDEENALLLQLGILSHVKARFLLEQTQTDPSLDITLTIQTIRQASYYFRDLLTKWADASHEIVNGALIGKLDRPIVFAGDSLGGADVQIDACQYLPKQERIPVTNVTFYAHSAPSIKPSDAEEFNQYLLSHGDLWKDLQRKISISHSWEKGDPVPYSIDYWEGYELTSTKHLGYDLQISEDLQDYVSAKALHFTPIPTSTLPGMKLALHTRRMGEGSEGVDFELEENVTIKNFDDTHLASSFIRIIRSEIAFFFLYWAIRAFRFFFGRRSIAANESQNVTHVRYTP